MNSLCNRNCNLQWVWSYSKCMPSEIYTFQYLFGFTSLKNMHNVMMQNPLLEPKVLSSNIKLELKCLLDCTLFHYMFKNFCAELIMKANENGYQNLQDIWKRMSNCCLSVKHTQFSNYLSLLNTTICFFWYPFPFSLGMSFIWKV